MIVHSDYSIACLVCYTTYRTATTPVLPACCHRILDLTADVLRASSFDFGNGCAIEEEEDKKREKDEEEEAG